MVHGLVSVTAVPFQGSAGCRRMHTSSSSSSSLKKCGGTLSFSANRAELAGLHFTTWTLTVLVCPRKIFAGFRTLLSSCICLSVVWRTQDGPFPTPVHATEHLETPQRGSLSSVHLITPKNPLLQLSILPWG